MIAAYLHACYCDEQVYSIALENLRMRSGLHDGPLSNKWISEWIAYGSKNGIPTKKIVSTIKGIVKKSGYNRVC